MNLKIAFPNKNNSEINYILKKCYVHFGIIISDFLRLPKLNENNISNILKLDSNTQSLLDSNNPAIIMTANLGNWELFLPVFGYNIYKASGSRRLTVLTARAAHKPVRKFLKDVGYSDVYVVALGDSNPQRKADWIQGQIENGYDDILFLDDSPKNVRVVKKLKQKYPNIKMDARVVKYD